MAVLAQLIALLDGMPDTLRGLLSALLLLLLLIAFDVWVQRSSSLSTPQADDDSLRANWRRLRLSFAGHRWRIAHTKTSLLALLLIPLCSVLLVDARLPLFVDSLPSAYGYDHWWLHGPLLLWLCIALVLMLRQLWTWRGQRKLLLSDTAPLPDAISKRAAHWQRRLGIEQPVTVGLCAVDEPLGERWPARTIVLPKAAAHWPAAATDVALIEQLCHFALQHHAWRVIAVIVGCLYWPFGFVRQLLPQRLRQDFKSAAAELAAACYRDPLGYRRATRALQERLGSGGSDQAVLIPDSNDPYGRVFLVFVQMVLAVYVLTGATLREIPDDSNFRYAEFVHDWYESFAPSAKYAQEPPTAAGQRRGSTLRAPAASADAAPRGAAPSRPAAPSTPPTPAPAR
ncbi:MAG: hypothetical protein AB8B93_05550 [Pseudomonadales bacterium]